MVYTDHYHLRQSDTTYTLINHDLPLCPCCGTILVNYGYRTRIYRDWMKFREEQHTATALTAGDSIRIRRLYCMSCRQIHHELPLCMRQP